MLYAVHTDKCRILASLEEVFDEVKMKRGVHDADMPKVDVSTSHILCHEMLLRSIFWFG